MIHFTHYKKAIGSYCFSEQSLFIILLREKNSLATDRLFSAVMY